MKPLEMPSKVTDRKFIRMPPSGNVVESDEEWSRCGKWILSIDGADMGVLDRAWVDLQPLLEDGTLIMLKASTAKLKHEGAHLHCFTMPGKEEIKRAASAIRHVVDFRNLMFYKLNKDTEAGISKREGYESKISSYMHTYRGKFWAKDVTGRWMPDDEDDEREVSPRSQFDLNNYSGRLKQSPSKSRERFWQKGVFGKENSNWYLFCSCSEKDGPLEIDRLWAVGLLLLAQDRLAALTACNNGPRGEVRFYLHLDAAPAASQLEWLCDRIFAEAGVRGVMYYTRRGDDTSLRHQRPLYDFKYTSDGELYELTRTGDAFVSYNK